MLRKRRRVQTERARLEDLILAGHAAAAEPEIVAALDRFPRDGRLHLLLAHSVANRDPASAVAAINQAARLEPGNSLLVLDAAWAMLPFNFERSRELLQLAIDNGLEDTESLALAAYLRGRHALRQDGPGVAVEDLRQAVRLAPTSQVFSEALVEVLMQLDDETGARRESGRAMKEARQKGLIRDQRGRLGFDQ